MKGGDIKLSILTGGSGGWQVRILDLCACSMPFRKGDRVRIRPDLTREECGESVIPYEYRGKECVIMESAEGVRAYVRIGASKWFIYPEHLEKIPNVCMFGKED